VARRVDGVLVGCPMCCLLPQRCQEPACERVCGREYAHSPVLARSGGVGVTRGVFSRFRKSALASCKTLAHESKLQKTVQLPHTCAIAPLTAAWTPLQHRAATAGDASRREAEHTLLHCR